MYRSTHNLQAWLNEKPRTVYAGFDPTSDSMHVGNLVAVMLLRRFQQAGHRPIALVGGATGMIGDPSGKSEERNLLSVEVLRSNMDGLEKQLRRFLDFDAVPRRPRLPTTSTGWAASAIIDFLRDVGKHFPVNVMLAKDSVKARLERTPDQSESGGMSYTEFSYMLLQAYDFVHLFDQYGCEMQVGGSDQWGNITAGIDLARRMRGVQLHGITCPLLLKSDGTKMGKTESGALWLSAERTSPYAFYQYWFNSQDCRRWQMPSLFQRSHAGPDRKPGKRTRGRSGQACRAEAACRRTDAAGPWRRGPGRGAEGIGNPLRRRDRQGIRSPTRRDFRRRSEQETPRSALDGNGMLLVDALCEVGLAKSKSDARRAISEGGAYVNNRRSCYAWTPG